MEEMVVMWMEGMDTEKPHTDILNSFNFPSCPNFYQDIPNIVL
jgi:hypothetical protein